MSVRVIFNLEQLLAAGGVRAQSGNGLAKYIRMPDGLDIGLPGDDDPHLHLSGDLMTARIPVRLDPKLIVGFTAHENVSTSPRRVGEYRYRSACGIVSPHTAPSCSYHIKYTGKRLEDIKKLHREFCEGLLWPVIDYGKPLSPPPFRQFGDLVHELWAVIRRNVALKFNKFRRA